MDDLLIECLTFVSLTTKSMSTLVIEDESQLARHITRALIRHGHDVVAEQDGAKGLKTALEHLPDLIVLDSGTRGRGKPKGSNGNSASTNSLSLGKGAIKGKGAKGKGSVVKVVVDRGYILAQHSDNFGIAASTAKKDAILIDRTKVYGTGEVAPTGGISLRNNGVVGPISWVDTGHTGVEPDSFADTFKYTFPRVEVPFTSGYFTPTGGKVDGVDYQYILDTGNYMLGKVDMTRHMLVRGDAVLYLTDNFTSDGKDAGSIIFQANATLKLYMRGQHFHMKADGVANNDVPASFQYYGLDKNKCCKIQKSADFSGVIYAPKAKVRITGGAEVYGSIVGKCVHADNAGGFHFDEALNRLYGDFEKFVIRGWREL